jgi:hypothetical protein
MREGATPNQPSKNKMKWACTQWAFTLSPTLQEFKKLIFESHPNPPKKKRKEKKNVLYTPPNKKHTLLKMPLSS